MDLKPSKMNGSYHKGTKTQSHKAFPALPFLAGKKVQSNSLPQISRIFTDFLNQSVLIREIRG